MATFQHSRPTDWARIATQYRSQILKESALLIRKEQNDIAESWDLFETGTMKKYLQGHFSVTDLETGSKLSMSYLNYFRFLDMPDARRKLRELKREGYHSYNRVVWGYLYNQTMPQLKHGFTSEIQQLMRNKIAEMVGSGTKESTDKIFLLQDMAESGDRYAQAVLSKSLRMGYK